MLGKELGLKWGRFWKELESYREKLNPPHTGRMLCEWYHVPPCFFVDDPYKGYVPFAVVRCPYERAISEFRCRWKGFNAPVGKNESKASKRKNATSADLNHWLQKKLKTVSSPPYTNGHFIPQHLYIFGEHGDHGHRYVAEENVLRFNNLSKDLAEFGVRHGIDIQNLPRQNESEMPRFSVEDLDETTRSMIERIFAKDFDLLGFKRLEATGR